MSQPSATRPLAILSLSTEFPNPSEPRKGLFVRARLQAMAAAARLTVVAPVALVDYANPDGNLLAALALPRRRSDAGLEVFHPRWLYPPYGGWSNAFLLFARLWPLVARLRERQQLDLIDAHFAHPEGIAAALLSAALGVPFMITIRGSELRYQRQRGKRRWMGWALRRAQRVIAVSDGLRALAIELGVEPERATTIPNGINGDMFFRRDKDECRRKHGLASDEQVIVSAGDLAELKGHHRTIGAVAALIAAGLRVRLLIVGGVGRSGRFADQLRTLAKETGHSDRIQFVGEVAQETLAELMSAADLFCLLSSTEGWPNVIHEALACGTPVVATAVGAVPQMIPSVAYGIVVPVGDERATVEALRAALARRWDHEAISRHGLSRSWRSVADEVLDNAREVVACSSL